jgi:hypothetical protein
MALVVRLTSWMPGMEPAAHDLDDIRADERLASFRRTRVTGLRRTSAAGESSS